MCLPALGAIEIHTTPNQQLSRTLHTPPHNQTPECTASRNVLSKLETGHKLSSGCVDGIFCVNRNRCNAVTNLCCFPSILQNTTNHKHLVSTDDRTLREVSLFVVPPLNPFADSPKQISQSHLACPALLPLPLCCCLATAASLLLPFCSCCHSAADQVLLLACFKDQICDV